MISLLERLVDKLWPKPIILIALLAFTFISIRDFFDKAKDYDPVFCLITTAIFVLINLYMVWSVIKCYYIPKVKKGALGILFLINAESREIHKDTESKLVDSFYETLKLKKAISYKVIVIPYDISARINNFSKEAFINLLGRKNSIYFIKVNVKCDECKQDNIYEIDISSAVVQKKAGTIFTDIIQREFKLVSSQLVRHRYSSNVKTAFLRLTAAQLTYICQYIIGISLLLDGQFENAANILNELKIQLASSKHDPATVGNVKDHLDWWGFKANILAAKQDIDSFSNNDNEAYLDKAWVRIHEANEYIPDKYEYHLNMAYYLVAKNRDINKAEEFINTE